MPPNRVRGVGQAVLEEGRRPLAEGKVCAITCLRNRRYLERLNVPTDMAVFLEKDSKPNFGRPSSLAFTSYTAAIFLIGRVSQTILATRRPSPQTLYANEGNRLENLG